MRKNTATIQYNRVPAFAEYPGDSKSMWEVADGQVCSLPRECDLQQRDVNKLLMIDSGKGAP